jgi:adenosylmethionine-8-amino-7-oxononanoate aminotransferase
MAYQYFHNLGMEGRRGFIALGEAYHGDTIGSVSLGGIGTFHRIFGPLLFEVDFVDTPNQFRNPDAGEGGRNVLAQIDRLLSDRPGHYCAVAVEPLVQGAAGILTHPEGFLAGVRQITRDHGVLMIADEVATGFCGTGRLFACEQEDVCPDLMSLGKRLTGGYLPVAATMAGEEIFDAFCGDIAESKTFFHGHTFTGNALGCAAALASVDLIFSSGLLDRLDEKIDLMGRRLAELEGHPQVADVRRRGMMAGVELKTDMERAGAAVCLAARERGIIIRPLGDVVVLMPAPAMDMDTLDRLMTGAVETIREFFS